MSKPLITIATPHCRDMEPEYVMSLLALADSNDLAVCYKFLEGIYIHKARNLMINTFLGDYLMFVDSDVAFQPKDIKTLIEVDKPIVAAPYICRHNERLMVFTFEGTKAVMHEPPSELAPVDAIGCGFMLVKREAAREILRQHPLPFNFLEHQDGEDMSFCYRCKQIGVPIWCHPGVKPLHVGVKIYGQQPDTATPGTPAR